jgi:hypothetical protein
VECTLAAKEERLARDHPLVKWTTAPRWAKENHVLNENEMRVSRREYKVVLEKYLVDCGYMLEEMVWIPDKTLFAKLMDWKDEVKPWNMIDDIDADTATEIRRDMQTGGASSDDIWAWKKWNFRCQFDFGDVVTESDVDRQLEGLWERFFVAKRERCFWNIVSEKRWSLEEVAAREGNVRYAMMAVEELEKRRVLAVFLGALGMKHSQEVKVFDHEALEGLGPVLEKVEAEVRLGFGMRGTRRDEKVKWEVPNTIDLMKVVLGGWGCGDIHVEGKQVQVKGVRQRKYVVKLNQTNGIWDMIYTYSGAIGDTCIIKL